MAKSILIDQVHLTVFAPPGLPEADCGAVGAAVKHPRFRPELRRAARALRRHFPALRKGPRHRHALASAAQRRSETVK